MARALEALPKDTLLADEPSTSVAIKPRARLLIYFSVLLALLLSSLDQTVVATALPRIVTDLQGADRYVWVVTAYMLCSTVTIPIYGKMSDVYGRRSMLLIAISLFVAGSCLSGLSQTMDQLIGFRALQGLGAGGFYPLAISVVGDLFSPRERGKYQGAIGAVAGLSFLIGPFVGGWFTEHASWHWIFYINIPLALLTMFAVATLLPNRRLIAARARDLDYLGVIIFVPQSCPSSSASRTNRRSTPQLCRRTGGRTSTSWARLPPAPCSCCSSHWWNHERSTRLCRLISSGIATIPSASRLHSWSGWERMSVRGSAAVQTYLETPSIEFKGVRVVYGWVHHPIHNSNTVRNSKVQERLSCGADVQQLENDSLFGLGLGGACATAPGCQLSEVARRRTVVVLEVTIGTGPQ